MANKKKTKAKDTYKLKGVNQNLLETAPTIPVFLVPVILFSAFTIMIVRMHVYSRSMSQFYWTPQTDDAQLTEFFSYNKAVFIIVMASIIAFFMIFRLLYKELTIKRSIFYIPMAVYSLFVILSYLFSDYKDFALLGYNERFEGTVPILCYMVVLFYVINTVNTEQDVKLIVWPVIISTILLGILGVTQGVGHDFFRSEIGQKIIAKNFELAGGGTVWQQISEAFARGETFFNFSFTSIYQTVYNPNYVSFYLTLLVPIAGMLFIRSCKLGKEDAIWKKILLCIALGLYVFNMIGSASSGGVIGIFVIVVLAVVVLNKQLLKMWKPLVILLCVAALVLGVTTKMWVPEIQSSFAGVFSKSASSETVQPAESEQAVNAASSSEKRAAEPGTKRPYVDYIKTDEKNVYISLNGNPLSVDLSGLPYGNSAVTLLDENGKTLLVIEQEDGSFAIDDDRFYDYAKVALTADENGALFFGMKLDGTDFWFTCDGTQVTYINEYGINVALTQDVEYNKFFNDRLAFGSNRGYIWSRSLPILKHTFFVGTGADTFCITFPQGDYAGRFNTNAGWMSIIVDKAHNMYIGMGIGTGCISLIAAIALYAIYIFQSIKVFWKREFESDFLTYIGAGIFLGVAGFVVTGLVDDSSVSVMPMFYTLLGTGIAINRILMNRDLDKVKPGEVK